MQVSVDTVDSQPVRTSHAQEKNENQIKNADASEYQCRLPFPFSPLLSGNACDDDKRKEGDQTWPEWWLFRNQGRRSVLQDEYVSQCALAGGEFASGFTRGPLGLDVSVKVLGWSLQVSARSPA